MRCFARSAVPAAALADSQGRPMLWEYGSEAKPQLLPCKAPGKVMCLAALGGGNGMLLAEVETLAYPLGNMGLAAGGMGQGVATVRFDWFQLYDAVQE